MDVKGKKVKLSIWVSIASTACRLLHLMDFFISGYRRPGKIPYYYIIILSWSTRDNTRYDFLTADLRLASPERLIPSV